MIDEENLIQEGKLKEVLNMLQNFYPSLNFKMGTHEGIRGIWAHIPKENHILQFSEREDWSGNRWLKIDLFKVEGKHIYGNERIRTIDELINYVDEFVRLKEGIKEDEKN